VEPPPSRGTPKRRPRAILSARVTGAMVRATVVVVGLVLALTSCTSDGPSASASTSGSGDVGGKAQSPAKPSHEVTRVNRRVVVPRAKETMPKVWAEVFKVSYGPHHEQLGTSRGGEGGDTAYGPESGARAPDGSWWFLDVAKLRLAHYSAGGRFLGAIKVPKRLLVNGRYFQWQLPHVLADGTLVAFRLTSGAGAMLRLRNGTLDEVPLTVMFSPTYDDGRLLYGSVAGGPRLATLDPNTGAVTQVSTYRLPSGQTFNFTDDFDRGKLELREAAASVTLDTVTASGDTAHMAVQARAGADDSLHLYLTGTVGGQGSAQLLAYLGISPSGDVTRAEPLANPFSTADRGSPTQLVVAAGDSIPMLVYVMPDGVHVYRLAR